MKLLVGLGNPGEKHSHNRHNVGFMAVDEIAAKYNASSWRGRFQGLVSEVNIDGAKCLLLKPETFMNLSGQSVGEAARFYKIEIEDVIIFYDELDLAPGKIKVKTGGGNAGHNGLKSITSHIGNEYQRVRIGIGHPGEKSRVARYVLHDFAKADRDWLEPLLRAIANACPFLMKDQAPRFLSDIALQLAPPKAEKPKQEQKSTPQAAKASTKPISNEQDEGPLAAHLKKLFPSKSTEDEN